MRRVVLGIGGLFLALAVALVVLMVTGPSVPATAPAAFSLDEVRALAGEGGPTRIRAAAVATGTFPRPFIVQDTRWELTDLPSYAVELVFPDGQGSVLIDPVNDDICGLEHAPIGNFDAAAFDRMQAAMLRADSIVATHEHYDHACGVRQSPHLEDIAGAVKFTKEQLESPARHGGIDDRVRSLVSPLVYDRLHLLAPGVVLIKAPGHTPGSQWVYIRHAEGREYLMVGDTVWCAEAVDQAKAKSWAAIFTVGEDVERQTAYTRFLHEFQQEHPEVELVVAHEQPWWDAALASGEFEPL